MTATGLKPTKMMMAIAAKFSPFEEMSGLPDKMLDLVWRRETIRGLLKGDDFQFAPATRTHMIKRYGIDPWKGPLEGAECCSLYMAELAKQYGGDLVKALCAYNAGPTKVNRAIRNHGDNWFAHVPSITRSYIKEVFGELGLNHHDNINMYAIKAERKEEQLAMETRKKALQEMSAQPIEPNSILTGMSTSLISALENLKHKMVSIDALSLTAPVPQKAPEENIIERFTEWFKTHVVSPAPVAEEANHNTIQKPNLPAKQAGAAAVAMPTKS